MEFPDVHHKMSKKIAQLTKVIYHLNTKNDDNEYQLQQITDLYECEIEEILEDAKLKIISYKSQLEESRSQDKAKVAVQELTRIHEKEKAEAVAEFTSFRKAALENEMRLKGESEEVITRLTNEVQSMRDKFLRRCTEFEEGQKGLEQKGYDALGELRKIKDAELENTIQEYNEKYKAMLAKQMQIQDDLEVSLNQQCEEKLAQAESTHRQKEENVQRLLETERQKLKAESELVKNLKTDNSAMIANISDLEARNEELKANEEKLNKNLQTMLSQLGEAEHSCDVLRRRGDELTKQGSEKDGELSRLQNELDGLQSLKENLSKSGGEKDQQIAQYQRDLNNVSDELASRVDQYEAQLRELHVLVQETNSDLEATGESLAQQTKEKELALMKVDSLSSDLSQRNRDLDALQERARAQAAQDAEKQAELERDIAGLQSSLQDEQRSRIHAEESLTTDMDTQLKTLRAQHDNAIAAKDSEHRGAVEGLQKSHEAQMAALVAEHNQTCSSYKDTVAGIEEQLARKVEELAVLTSRSAGDAQEWQTTKQALTADNESLSQELAAVKELLASKERDLAALDQSMSSSTSELRELLAQREREASQMQASHKAEAATLSAQLEAARREKQDSERTLMADSMSERESLRAQLEAEHARNVQRELQELRQMTKQTHAEDMAAEQKRLETLRQEAEQRLEAEVSAAKDSLRQAEDRHEQEVKALRDSMDSSLHSSQSKEADLKSAMDALRATHKGNVDELKRNFAADLATLQETMKAQSDAALQQRDTQHAGELAELRKTHETTVNDLTSQHNRQLQSDTQALRDEHARTLKQVVAEREEQHSKEVTRLIEAKELDHQQTLQRTITGWETRVAEAVRAREALEVQYATLEGAKRALEADLEHSRVICSDTAANGEQRASELQAEMDQKIQSLKERHADDVKKARTAHHQNVQKLTEEFTEVQKQMKEKHVQLQAKIAELEYRYANRESRDEDVEKINALIAELTAKDEALLRAHNDLRWYKLELVNREENYNKVFGRQPTIAGGHPPAPGRGSSAIPEADQKKWAAGAGAGPAAAANTIAGRGTPARAMSLVMPKKQPI